MSRCENSLKGISQVGLKSVYRRIRKKKRRWGNVWNKGCGCKDDIGFESEKSWLLPPIM
jgi:hypothetical protein